MATNLPSCFSIQFLEQLLKFLVNFTLLKYVKSFFKKLWLFNHKRADFWLPNFGFKRSLLSLLKPWSNELDFSQYNMQHLSSGKSRDRLTILFIHVETCRNMLYVVEGSLIGIKNVASKKVVQQYISFVSEVRAQFGTNVAAKCSVRLTTQRSNNMQQCATECPTNVACCIRKVELV